MATEGTFDRFTADTWRAMLQQRGGAFRLGKDTEMDLTLNVCSNPECSCETISLCLRESVPQHRRAALAFDVEVDVHGEEPAAYKALGPDAERLAKIMAAGLGGPARARLREALREHRRRLRRVPQSVAEYVARGELVPLSHVQNGGAQTDGHYAGFLDEFYAENLDWQVVDHMCGSRMCDCNSVHLTFLATSDTGKVKFTATVSTDGGHPTFADLAGIPLATAKQVFADWEVETPFDRATLKSRYELVRQHAKAGAALLAAKAPAPGRTAASVSAKAAPGLAPKPRIVPPLGRREPCPCGSGKRYKNCCGASDR